MRSHNNRLGNKLQVGAAADKQLHLSHMQARMQRSSWRQLPVWTLACGTSCSAAWPLQDPLRRLLFPLEPKHKRISRIALQHLPTPAYLPTCAMVCRRQARCASGPSSSSTRACPSSRQAKQPVSDGCEQRDAAWRMVIEPHLCAIKYVASALCPLQAESSEGVRLDICLNTGALHVAFQ